MDHTPPTPEKNTDTRPDWLKTLETESWSPELLISGLAIVASLQFSAYIEDFRQYTLFNFDETLGVYSSILITYLAISSYAITLNFSIHFILRVFWIGILGLMSVYPEGIRFEHYPYGGVHFISKLKEKLQNLQHFSLQLDRICSIIFSFSALIVLSLISISIFIGGCFGITLLLDFLLPQFNLEEIGGFIMVAITLLVLFPSVIISIFNYTHLKHTRWGQKIHFPLYWFFSSLFFNILNRPFHYISLTFATNTKMWKVSLMTTAYLLLLSAFFVVKMGNHASLFETRHFYTSKPNALALSYDHYENLRPTGSYIFQPTIPSDIISGKYVKLFLPYTKRLDKKLDKICLYKADSQKKKASLTTTPLAQHRSQTARSLQCLQQLYAIYLNDSLLQASEGQLYQHPNQGEKGILHYLRTDSLQMGKHILRIERLHLEEKKETTQWEIPFWLE